MKFIVAQLGARGHYAIPRMLHQVGMLEHFYTDICAVKGVGKIARILPEKRLPNALKRLRSRVPEGVPEHKITVFEIFGAQYVIRRNRAKNYLEMFELHRWAGRKFNRQIIEKGFGNATAVYAFKSAALELFQAAREQGLKTILEQISAPAPIQQKLIGEEQERFQGWIKTKINYDPFPEQKSREKAEWECADIILCASEFTKKSIAEAGGPTERCFIVPYGVDSRFNLPEKKTHTGPLRVLFAGAVNLNKGAPYVLEAARRLKNKAVFRMIGDIQVTPRKKNILAEHVELTGLVPRSEMIKHYAWADVFLFPSICDGFGLVLIEALSAGLPVITTPNTGVAIRDGKEGFIVPIRSFEPIVEAITKLKDNPGLWQDMSQAARTRSREFTLEAYQNRLLKVLTGENLNSLI